MLCEIEQTLPSDKMIVPLQLKEKYGRLRFYYSLESDDENLHHEIEKIVDKYEKLVYYEFGSK